MNEQLKFQIRYISVVNFGNSPAITCYLRLDVTNFEFNLPRPTDNKEGFYSNNNTFMALKAALADMPHYNEANRMLVIGIYQKSGKKTRLNFTIISAK